MSQLFLNLKLSCILQTRLGMANSLTFLCRPPLPGAHHPVDDLRQAVLAPRCHHGGSEEAPAGDLPAHDVAGEHLALALDGDHAALPDGVAALAQHRRSPLGHLRMRGKEIQVSAGPKSGDRDRCGGAWGDGKNVPIIRLFPLTIINYVSCSQFLRSLTDSGNPDLYAPERARGVHAGGLVDRVAPDVEHRLRRPDHAAHQRADAHAYKNVVELLYKLRPIFIAKKHKSATFFNCFFEIFFSEGESLFTVHCRTSKFWHISLTKCWQHC